MVLGIEMKDRVWKCQLLIRTEKGENSRLNLERCPCRKQSCRCREGTKITRSCQLEEKGMLRGYHQ